MMKRKHTEESKEKMRQAVKKQFALGRTHPWEGTNLSDEWRENISKNRKGKAGSFGHLGKSHSEETKLVIREKRAKQTFSEETRNKLSENAIKRIIEGSFGAQKGSIPWNKGKPVFSMRGENHPNWKNGATSEALQVRHSLEYKIWRTSVFSRDNYTCQECKVRGGNMEADHIKPFSIFKKLRFDINNGRTLCKACHKKIGWSLFKNANPKKKLSISGFKSKV